MSNIELLQKRMIEKSVGTCVITDTKAIAYFIDKTFHVGERMIALIVKQSGKPQLILNKLFPCNEQLDAEIVRYSDAENSIVIMADMLEGTVAIDKSWDAHFLLDLIRIKPEMNYITGYIVDEIKAIKNEDERVKMRIASINNDKVMERVAELIQLGKSEKQLAEEINEAFMEIAHSKPSFTTIVAYGDHGADPHAEPSDRVLKEGENVIVDMGCMYEGYCSDMTRTFFVNKNTEKEVYDTVLAANLAGIAAVKPGIPFKDIDKAARDVIENAGYGEYFIHRLGHGIGMTVHEPFDVSATDEVIVEEGMCFSIEPGIYIPGRVGVRIEDLVCVTKDGCEVLNSYPKDMEIVNR